MIAHTAILVFVQACSQPFSYAEKAMPKQVELSPRLQAVFSKTKLLCFGRYALQVPHEAQLDWGTVSIPSRIDIIGGGLANRDKRIAEDIAKIKFGVFDPEVTYNGSGPVEESWQVRYFESESAKEFGQLFFNTYVTLGEITFILGGSIEKGGTEASTAAREAMRAKSLRLRLPGEVPETPGHCIEHGFMADNLYNDQEMVSVGLFLPSFPDVRFSVQSNKDAYADYPKAEFEDRLRAQLSLLARIEQAKRDQPLSYPKRTVLREGTRDVQHWHGEESLIRREDGVHDFEWAFVGTPEDVANPSEFSAHMFTKVEHNTVGAAKKASVSDSEAVALYDRLLGSLKFRVKVPNAPPGSYYLEAANSK